MIETDLQYEITKREAKKFRRAINNQDPCPDGVEPTLHQALYRGMREKLSEMEAEMYQFEQQTAVAPNGTVRIPY